jgi:hypothetical protein
MRQTGRSLDLHGEESTMSAPEVRVEDLKQRLDACESLFLLDVRDESECEIPHFGGQLIPLLCRTA